MEPGKQIECAIAELKRQKEMLEEKIKADEMEKAELETYLAELNDKTKALNESIADSNQKMQDLMTTLIETENGYGKLVTAGQTLMEIVSKSLGRHNISLNNEEN